MAGSISTPLVDSLSQLPPRELSYSTSGYSMLITGENNHGASAPEVGNVPLLQVRALSSTGGLMFTSSIARHSRLPLFVLVTAGACSDGGRDPVGPSDAVPLEAQTRSQVALTIQEDLINPCNGEVIHMTTDFLFSTVFYKSGREVDAFSSHGTGVSDHGNRYTSHTISHASSNGPDRENNIGIEHVDGSAPGSSFMSRLRVIDFFTGSGTQYGMLRSDLRCRS